MQSLVLSTLAHQGPKIPHGIHGFSFRQHILGHGAPFRHQGRDLEKQRHEEGGEEALHLELLTRYQQQLVDSPGGLDEEQATFTVTHSACHSPYHLSREVTDVASK